MPYQIIKKVIITPRREWFRGEYASSLGVDLEDKATWKFFALSHSTERQIRGKVVALFDENGNSTKTIGEEYVFDVGLYQYYGANSSLQEERFLFLPKEFVQSYAIAEGTIVEFLLEEVIKDGQVEALFSKSLVVGPQDVVPKEKTIDDSENKSQILAYCRNCGNPQGVFPSLQEMQKSIAQHSKCQKCGLDFSFQSDGQIYGLNWEKIAPEAKEKKENVYGKGDSYDFYRDIKRIIYTAQTEVFLIDAWIDEEGLDLYLDKVPVKVNIRILTKKPQGNFITVAKKFKSKPNVSFEVRGSNDCHDRLLFIDNECWVMGQSISDAGKKPTYLIRTEKCETFRNTFETMWKSASIIV